MQFTTIQKIIDELASPKFKDKYTTTKIEIGENGDAVLNPDFIKNLRYIKNKVPNIHINIFTNFVSFSKELLEVVFKEKLINSFNTNIDGFDEDTYKFMKNANFNKVITNIKEFIKIRDSSDFKPRLAVWVLTYKHYYDAIRDNFSITPINARNKIYPKTDNFELIRNFMSEIIDINNDTIKRPLAFAWAERTQFNNKSLNYNKISCPILNRIENELFVAPDGTSYLCCYDSKQELNIGNIYQNTLQEIINSERRNTAINLLKDKKFDIIGGPCKTVNCCQALLPKKEWSFKKKIKMMLKI